MRRGALAPGAALPQAGAATALVGRAVPDDYYTLWYRSDRCSADLRHDYYYSDSLFDHAATEYDDKLALATLGMAAAADSSWESDQYYWMTGEVGRAAHIRDAFAKLGFAEVQLFNYTHSLNDAPDTAACAVARKTLVRGGRQVTIIGAFVRGSGYGAEWSGNLHTGSGSAHTGFVAAARQLTEKNTRICSGIGQAPAAGYPEALDGRLQPCRRRNEFSGGASARRAAAAGKEKTPSSIPLPPRLRWRRQTAPSCSRTLTTTIRQAAV